MRLVIDTSVAVKWFLPEPDSSIAVLLISDDILLIAPDYLLIEVDHVLWRACRNSRMSQNQFLRASMLVGKFIEFHHAAPLRPLANRLAVTHGHPVYDSHFVALASVERVPLVSADIKQLQAAAAADVDAISLGKVRERLDVL